METKEQHCQRGGTNPLDETFPECEGCEALLYDDEATETENGEILCGDCVAHEIEQGLKGVTVHFAGIIDGELVFKMEPKQ